MASLFMVHIGYNIREMEQGKEQKQSSAHAHFFRAPALLYRFFPSHPLPPHLPARHIVKILTGVKNGKALFSFRI